MIKFVGDICLSDNDFDKGFGVGSRISSGLNPFSLITKNDDEFWIGNMECVLSNHTHRLGYNKDCFRDSPKTLESDNLIDCYSVANNHIMEHGPEAYYDTINAIRCRNKHIVGSNEQKSTIILDDGKRISISSFSLRCDNTVYKPEYWYSPELTEIKEEIEQQIDCDFHIAYIHWGVEFMPYPYAEQQKLAHYLIDIGFDLIIGVHPHVLQGYEIYNNKYIFYSLGNFIFNMAYSETHWGLIVSFNPKNSNVMIEYAYINDDFSPSVANEKDIPKNLNMEHLNSLIGKHPNVEQYSRIASIYLKKYRKSHHRSMLRNLFKYDISFIKGMGMTFIQERFFKK